MLKHENYALCLAHLNKFVRIQMVDGAVYEGVIEHVDEEHVYIACPVRSTDEDARFFPYPYGGLGYPYAGFYGGYPFGYYPGFRRFGLPLGGILGLSALPFLI